MCQDNPVWVFAVVVIAFVLSTYTLVKYRKIIFEVVTLRVWRQWVVRRRLNKIKALSPPDVYSAGGREISVYTEKTVKALSQEMLLRVHKERKDDQPWQPFMSFPNIEAFRMHLTVYKEEEDEYAVHIMIRVKTGLFAPDLYVRFLLSQTDLGKLWVLGTKSESAYANLIKRPKIFDKSIKELLEVQHENV